MISLPADNGYGKIAAHRAPIAQWIERWPPEPKTAVRVCLGVPKQTHLELRDVAVEEFLEMLRFDQRDKVAEVLCGAELSSELLRESSR